MLDPQQTQMEKTKLISTCASHSGGSSRYANKALNYSVINIGSCMNQRGRQKEEDGIEKVFIEEFQMRYILIDKQGWMIQSKGMA